MRLLERVKALEAKNTPDVDWNLVCKQLAEQIDLMTTEKGIYNHDAYLMPIYKSQEDFDRDMAERRETLQKLCGNQSI